MPGPWLCQDIPVPATSAGPKSVKFQKVGEIGRQIRGTAKSKKSVKLVKMRRARGTRVLEKSSFCCALGVPQIPDAGLSANLGVPRSGAGSCALLVQACLVLSSLRQTETQRKMRMGRERAGKGPGKGRETAGSSTEATTNEKAQLKCNASYTHALQNML